jgi:DNA polymerase-1
MPELWGQEGRWVALDTETTGLAWAPGGANVLLATLYSEDKNGRPWYGAASRDRLDRLVEWLVRFVRSGGVLVLQNNKFDFHQLGLDPTTFPARSAPAVPAILDTAVLAHLVDSRDFKSLANLEEKYLGTTTKADYQSAHKGKKGGSNPANWQAAGEKGLFRYALNDVRVTYKVAEVLWKRVRLLGCEPLYRKEVKYLGLLWRMERRGVELDVPRIQNSIRELTEAGAALEQEMYRRVGYEFNWRSNPQLSKALYEDFRTDDGRKIKKPVNPFLSADGIDHSKMAHKNLYNQYGTNSFILLEKANHPLGSLVLALRETAKLKKVLESWLEEAHEAPEEVTLHANFNLTGTRTGRISSSNPNLQNVPGLERVHETQAVYTGNAFHRSGAYNLRACLKARAGYTFVSVDHQQQEGRLFGIISGDPNMRTALENKLDIHMMVAKLVWGDQGEMLNKLHREWAKTISFGMIYGMTTGSLQHRLNKTREEADAIANKYLETFPRIGPFLNEVIRTVTQAGYVRYWSGRIWRETDKRFAYKGANALVQGGSADLISVAALRCQHYLDDLGTRGSGSGGDAVGHLALIVHDELVFEVKDEWLEEVIPQLLSIMEVRDLFGLPFPADAKVGKNFGEMEKLK